MAELVEEFDVIKVNSGNYDLACQRVRDGHWSVDPELGLLKPDGSLAGALNWCGYLRARFTHEGRTIMVLAHRVVWLVAKGPIPEGLYVNHIDGDKTNNALANLELVTQAGNMRHAANAGLMPTRTAGTMNVTWNKLTAAQAAEIKVRLADGETCAAIARDYGMDKSSIHHIKSGKTWAHIDPSAFGLRHE